MTTPQLTPEQLCRLIDLWFDIGKPAGAAPTPEQELEFYRRAGDDLALHRIGRRRDAADVGARCFEFDHDGALSERNVQRDAYIAALGAVDRARALAAQWAIESEQNGGDNGCVHARHSASLYRALGTGE